ncbi:NADP-dependent oxidoreductase domain-containing protein 1 [Perognathus longimembris pacificus]|uniref:NADP-dependent oxidoreductase domain-containing protein 1 n=1 Tax=Perognathus longimembris pacificus TaxID=214514 RepID=UPI00201850C7|nr:NADP-dependent oxidoreductase domain-containing protein 1 [Perognathus longimembris pacificus]
MDILADLETLKFEYGIPEEERFWLYLQSRSRGLLLEACAHAVFLCKLLRHLRMMLNVAQGSERPSSGPSNSDPDPASSEFKVGIIGGGRLGKQLAWSLLQLVPIPAENLRISTRRPDILEVLQKRGIQCFYHNSHLVGWANVVFLCCLPSQLPNICLEIQASVEKNCIVHSFASAIPLPRLRLLLNNHTSILRPMYYCVEDTDHIWGTNKDIPTALQDPVILQATSPFSSRGGITLNIKWLEGVLYAILNVCTERNVFYPKALEMLNKLFFMAQSGDSEKEQASCPSFQLKHFVNQIYVRNLFHRRPLPWFDLTTVQLKDTPLSQHLSASPALQDHLNYVYCKAFGISVTKQQPVVTTDSSSQQGTSRS